MSLPLPPLPQKKNICHVTPPPPYNGHYSTTAALPCPQGGRYGEVRQYIFVLIIDPKYLNV